MAVIFMDGFDGADPGNGKWTEAAVVGFNTATPRTGSRGMNATGNFNAPAYKLLG